MAVMQDVLKLDVSEAMAAIEALEARVELIEARFRKMAVLVGTVIEGLDEMA